MSGYSGADWLKSGISATGISPLGETVANILGDVFLGIYHLNYTSLRKVDWKNNSWIQVTFYGGLSTFDTDQLTRLVVLCHDRMVRLEIRAAAPGYLRLLFHPRHSRDGRQYERHPTLEDAAARIRADYADGKDGQQP
jgi:hypothetical protein